MWLLSWQGMRGEGWSIYSNQNFVSILFFRSPMWLLSWQGMMGEGWSIVLESELHFYTFLLMTYVIYLFTKHIALQRVHMRRQQPFDGRQVALLCKNITKTCCKLVCSCTDDWVWCVVMTECVLFVLRIIRSMWLAWKSRWSTHVHRSLVLFRVAKVSLQNCCNLQYQ